MGRQAYLTRLALGRSPFEAPELDEDGNFLLGPHANDFAADDYVQQFDHRGHPQNPKSAEIDQAVRRAKNEVSELMGAVVRKARRPNAREQKLAFKEGASLFTFHCLNAGLAFTALWWVHALRRRVQTYRSFDSVPLLDALRSERRIVGIGSMLTAGMTMHFVSLAIDVCNAQFFDGPVEIIMKARHRKSTEGGAEKSWSHAKAILRFVLTTSIEALTFNLKFLSILQSLFLVPSARFNLQSLIPFSRSSPIQIPPLPASITPISLLRYGGELLTTPLIFALAHGILYSRFNHLFTIILRESDVGPGWSLKSLKQYDFVVSVPGFGILDRARVPKLVQNIGDGVSNLQNWVARLSLLWWSPKQRRYPLAPHLEGSIRMEASRIYRDRIRQLSIEGTRIDDAPLHELAGTAIREALVLHGFASQADPDININFDEWVADLQRDLNDGASTATPEPEQFFSLENVNIAEQTEVIAPGDTQRDQEPVDGSGTSRRSTNATPSAEQGENSLHIQGNVGDDNTVSIAIPPALALSLASRSSDSRDEAPVVQLSVSTVDVPDSMEIPVVLPTGWNPRALREESPSPGITRAQSLAVPAEEWTREELAPWPTTEPEFGPRSEVHGAGARRTPELPSHQSARSSSSRSPFLPALNARMVSRHATALLTTAVMLPLESRLVESLALGFLNSPSARPGAAVAAAVIKSDVRGIGFHGNDWGLKYMGSMALLLGLQGVISAGVWGSTAALSIRVGRLLGRGAL